MEITPTFIHYNMVDSNKDQNNVFAISAGARMKITKRMAITAEYNYLFPNQLNSQLNTIMILQEQIHSHLDGISKREAMFFSLFLPILKVWLNLNISVKPLAPGVKDIFILDSISREISI